MSTVSESSRFVRPSPTYLAWLLFFWGVFAFFTVCQVLRRDLTTADPETLAELQALSFASAKQAANDWPQWRGPRRDGLSLEAGLMTTWPEGGPPRLWQQPTGEGFATLAVAQGRVYTMVQDGDQEAIVCWDAQTGAERWRHRTPAYFRHKFGNGPRSTPTVDGDLLYAVGATGIMTCLRIGDSEPVLLWKKPLLEDFAATSPEWGVSFSPLVDGDLVYVNPGGPDGGSLAALDKHTGAVRWQALDDRAGNSSPVMAECGGQRQVIFFTETGLVAVTPDQGKLLWRFPWKTDFGANISTPVVAGDYVFLSSGYGKGCALVKIEKHDQELRPRQVYRNAKMKSQFASCVLYREHLYGFNDTTLTCMEFRTGKVAWTERGFDKGSLTIADGHLFVLGEYGTLAVAPATPAGYRESSRLQFSEKRCWSVPVIANGRMYVRNEEKVVCYDLRPRNP